MRALNCYELYALALMLALSLCLPQPAMAQSRPAGSPSPAGGEPTVVVVKVPKPWYAPNALVVRKMRKALPQYQRIPGLTFKIFTLARPEGEFGGVYLWQDRASAEAWFTSAWHARVRKERGVEADVRMFDAPLAFAAPAAAAAKLDTLEDAVLTLVTVATPAQTSREDLRRGFAAAAAIERNAPGLLRKYAVVANGRSGGAYLWRDEASARAWFDARWQAKMRELHGAVPQVEWFDAPILLPSTAPANRAAERAILATSGSAGR
jgi:Putative mono-oxygenase ydhR